ncbi:MAG: hypothetical protein WCT42_02580 [Candidatus Paceibacterota bacterium]
MTTSELISYIKKQIGNNVSKDLIISKLINAGWHKGDIDEAFSIIELEFKAEVIVPKINETVVAVVPEKIEVKKEDHYHDSFSADINVDEKIELSQADTIKIEIPKEEKEVSKVWIPKNVPVIKNEEIVNQKINTPLDKEETKDTFIEVIKKEELIPALIPKVAIDSFGSVVSKDNSIPIATKETTDNVIKNYPVKNLSQIAMLSSYEKDMSSVDKTKYEVVNKKNNNTVKWIIALIIVLLLSGGVWVFAGGYISLKNFNIPFIKKDPKILLLNNSKVLSSLKSYKTETSVEVSSPSFSNISSGLVSGETVSSQDKDSISINIMGIINQNGEDLFSDSFITLKGSLLPNYITTDVKSNGSSLFISIPDLSQIMKDGAPGSVVIKVNENEAGLLSSLFSGWLKPKVEKIDIYKVLSNGIASYLDDETLSVYDEFINNAEVIEKGEDSIKGVDTYHYQITPDRQLTKKLLSKISDNFLLNISDEEKDSSSKILGSVMVDSFEVWVGKGDNNIYQYNVNLSVPLSKIIGFEDKSIGDNKVNISLKTTYYDFDIANNIFMPEKSILMTDFINDTEVAKIKNDTSSFKQLATNLFNVERVYGSKSNADGSCMNPSSGSLFSPIGHTKKATTEVSSISELLNKILKTTNGVGFCYGTSKDWSFAIPIYNNYDSSAQIPEEYKYLYCVDSTGAAKELTAPPTGTVCK